MNEIYDIFIQNLHKILKSRINAGIFCEIRDNCLYVRMKNDDIIWECAIVEIWKYVCQVSGSVDLIANKIVKAYRREILKRYFYGEDAQDENCRQHNRNCG